MHIVIVGAVEVGSEQIAPMSAVKTITYAVSLLVVLGITGVHVKCPGLPVALRDDVDNAASSIAAIQCRRCTLYYLYAFHVVHVESCKVHIVHRFACQPFAIHKEEHSLPAKPGKIKMGLLVHGIREFHSRQLLLQQILHIRSILPGYILGIDDTSLYRSIFQELGRARACHHHFVKSKLTIDGIGIGLLRSCSLSEGGSHQYEEQYMFHFLIRILIIDSEITLGAL